MSKFTTKEVQEVHEVTEVERTINYIQFQISQADEMLAPYANRDINAIHFVHLLAWKRSLQNELFELRKTLPKTRFTK